MEQESAAPTVAVVADTSGSISREEAGKMGVVLVPVPFHIGDDLYFEEVTISHAEFYQRSAGARCRTTQPNVADVTDVWDEVLKTHEQLVYIPMSAGLSSSYENLYMQAKTYEGRVEVINAYRVCGPMGSAIRDCVWLRDQGRSAAEIRQAVEEIATDYSSFVMVDTLEPLKQGGRITPAAAAIATVLGIKPILTFGTGVLGAFAKVRGKKAAIACMLDATEAELQGRLAPFAARGEMQLRICQTNCPEEAEAFAGQVAARFPGMDVRIDATPLNIACHIGAGALALFCIRCIRPITKGEDPQ